MSNSFPSMPGRPLISSASSTASSDSVRLVHPVTPCAESCVILAAREILGRIQQWASLRPDISPKEWSSARPSPTCQVWVAGPHPVPRSTPRIPLHNNATERALRGVVIGRKNHYGSRSRRGTEVAALFYSLWTAKLNKLDPASYLSQIARAAIRARSSPPASRDARAAGSRSPPDPLPGRAPGEVLPLPTTPSTAVWSRPSSIARSRMMVVVRLGCASISWCAQTVSTTSSGVQSPFLGAILGPGDRKWRQSPRRPGARHAFRTA